MEEKLPTSSHDEKYIFEGCIILMNKLVDQFQDYVENNLDINISELDDEDLFAISMPKEEIVQTLFLGWTNHSGGGSTRKKCRELGLDTHRPQLFCFDEVIDRDILCHEGKDKN